MARAKRVEDDQAFWFRDWNGNVDYVAHDMNEFKDAIEAVPTESLEFHLREDRNDFSVWLENIMNRKGYSSKVQKIKEENLSGKKLRDSLLTCFGRKKKTKRRTTKKKATKKKATKRKTRKKSSRRKTTKRKKTKRKSTKKRSKASRTRSKSSKSKTPRKQAKASTKLLEREKPKEKKHVLKPGKLAAKRADFLKEKPAEKPKSIKHHLRKALLGS